MIFWFDHAFGTRDPDARKIFAQARQRAFMQEPGEVIRSIWHEFAAAEPNEQVEIFAFDFFGRGRSAASASAACARPSGEASARSAERLDSSAASGARIRQRWQGGHIPGPARRRHRRHRRPLPRTDLAGALRGRLRLRFQLKLPARQEPESSLKRRAARCLFDGQVRSRRQQRGSLRIDPVSLIEVSCFELCQ